MAWRGTAGSNADLKRPPGEERAYRRGVARSDGSDGEFAWPSGTAAAIDPLEIKLDRASSPRLPPSVKVLVLTCREIVRHSTERNPPDFSE